MERICKARHGNVRQGKAWQGRKKKGLGLGIGLVMARQGKEIKDTERQDMERHGKARHGMEIQFKERHGMAR
jgi:hypothetical protein